MMFLNSVFLLNFPLGLTLIQSSLKALKGGVVEGFNTHRNTHTHTYIHSHINAYRHTTKGGCSFRVAAAHKPVCQRHGPLSSKTDLQTDFLHIVVLISVKEKVTCVPLCMKVGYFVLAL